MKILYIVPTTPFPPTYGAQLRELAIGRLLRKCGKVTLVFMADDDPAQALELARADFDDVVALARVESPARHGIAPRLAGAAKKLWPGYFGQTLHPDQLARFRRALPRHDVAWYHTLMATDWLGVRSMRRAVVDMDDLMHCKFAMDAALERGRRRLRARWWAVKWRRREMTVLRKFGVICACSDADKRILGGHDRIHVVPNGFDRPEREPVWQPRTARRLGFIGPLCYEPNYDAVAWFRDAIWPLVVRDVPDARLRVVGKLPEDRPPLDHPGFDLLGYVNDPAGEIATWSAMVVPLRIGVGTRIKIIEAFSRKCPVISTSIGAYGNEAEHGRHLLLADRPDEFARACVRLLQRPDSAAPMAEEAWRLFVSRYTWDSIGGRVEAALDDCLRQPLCCR
ncbi:MAG TPA: glycosyltransferase family 4 protein [Planctomycetota bacterium]|nr:glycosyltransferase family 4 protein [Planctomycetota bacterium]